jgi:hypothetical protein
MRFRSPGTSCQRLQFVVRAMDSLPNAVFRRENEMSTRRTESSPRSQAPTSPPILFRLPDLTRPAQNSPTPAVPTRPMTAPYGNSGDGRMNLVGPAPSFISAYNADQTSASASTLSTPATAPTPNQTNTADTDRPAKHGWMDSLGSNKGIALMIAMVLIAAWWTSPNRKGVENLQPSDASLVQQATDLGESDLSVDPGNPATADQAADAFDQAADVLASSSLSQVPAGEKNVATNAAAFAAKISQNSSSIAAEQTNSTQSSVAPRIEPQLTKPIVSSKSNSSSASKMASTATPSERIRVDRMPQPTGTGPTGTGATGTGPTGTGPTGTGATDPGTADSLHADSAPSVAKESSLALAMPDLSSFSTPATTISTTTSTEAEGLQKMSLETESSINTADGHLFSTTPNGVDWSRYLLDN